MYTLIISKSAEKSLSALPGKMYHRLLAAIQSLADDPRPPGCKKLKGVENLYRLREGDYRVIYSVEDRVLRVIVVAVGNRKDVYE